MTLKSQIISEASTVFLNTDEFAESITHYPGGGNSGSPVTAIVTYDETSKEGGNLNEVHRSAGFLCVGSDVSMSSQDRVTIGDADYQVTKVDPVQAGMRKVYFQGHDFERRTVRDYD